MIWNQQGWDSDDPTMMWFVYLAFAIAQEVGIVDLDDPSYRLQISTTIIIIIVIINAYRLTVSNLSPVAGKIELTCYLPVHIRALGKKNTP